MADKTLITLGMKCPRPLFEVSRSIKTIEADGVLEVHADDPAFRPDIEAWCRRTGNALLELRAEGHRFIAMVKRHGPRRASRRDRPHGGRCGHRARSPHHTMRKHPLPAPRISAQLWTSP